MNISKLENKYSGISGLTILNNDSWLEDLKVAVEFFWEGNCLGLTYEIEPRDFKEVDLSEAELERLFISKLESTLDSFCKLPYETKVAQYK